MNMVSPVVRLRAESLGDDGRRWLEELPGVVAELEVRWTIRLDRSLSGGTAAFVASGWRSDGVPVVLKIGVPAPTLRDEIGTLERAGGRGYVRLLAHDAPRGAMLLEALGESLSTSGLPPEQQLRVLGALAATAWTVPRAEAGPAAMPVNKAAELRDFVDRLWRKLQPDCSVRVRDEAVACADRRAAAFDPATCVVVHGDAAAANALRVLESRAGAETGFVFVDPDGFVGDPTYDFGVALRDWCPELLASADPRALIASYAEVLAAHAGFDPATILDWAYLERVSTSLYVLSIGAADLGQPFLQTARALL
jgi:streptomycin 6-kinase